jgi:hypothetical protein
MSLVRSICFGIAAAVPLVVAQSTSGTGTLSGSVTDTNGAPLAGVLVRYMSLAPPAAPAPHASLVPASVVSGSVSSDTSGNFSVFGLPAGAYALCTNSPSAPYLDLCTWRPGVTVTVPAGGSTSQALVLERGVYLNVRVSDPSHLLPQAVDGPWTPRKLVVGVRYGSGAYQGAANTEVDSAGRGYRSVIPAGVPFSLWLFSSDVALADASGAALGGPAATVPFQAAAGQDQSFTFTVVGPAGHAQ